MRAFEEADGYGPRLHVRRMPPVQTRRQGVRLGQRDEMPGTSGQGGAFGEDRMKRLFWSFVHNCIAHPIMFWTGDARWAVRLHDHSALTAWPDRPLRRDPRPR